VEFEFRYAALEFCEHLRIISTSMFLAQLQIPLSVYEIGFVKLWGPGMVPGLTHLWLALTSIVVNSWSIF